jgi:hypothetical protein
MGCHRDSEDGIPDFKTRGLEVHDFPEFVKFKSVPPVRGNRQQADRGARQGTNWIDSDNRPANSSRNKSAQKNQQADRA